MQEALEALESRLDPQSPKLKFTSGFYNSLTNSEPSLSFIKTMILASINFEQLPMPCPQFIMRGN